jgi:hypothetical protein
LGDITRSYNAGYGSGEDIVSDGYTGSADGDQRLGQIAATLRSGGAVEPLTVRELLQWFGAECRGVRVNRMIRDALFVNDIRIEPDLNAKRIDDLLEFRDGRLIDDVEEKFFKTHRRAVPGQRINEIEAEMLNKIYHELIADNLVGWVDRNPSVTENDIRAAATALSKLGFDELEREEGAVLLSFPTPSLRIGRASRVATSDIQPGADVSEETSWVLTVLHSRGRITPGEMAEERRNRDRLCMAIGRFMFEFSQLEFYIRYALKCALGLDDEKFTVIAYDFAPLCKATDEFFRRFVEHAQHDQKEIKSLFNDCLSINDRRVQIAHGTWFVDETGLGAQHVRRGSFTPKVVYEKIGELDQITEKTKDLQSRVSRLLIWPFQWQTQT